jgi:periplasmic protein TonB
VTLLGWRAGSRQWQAARLTAIALSLLAHSAAAAWIFSAPNRPAEHRIESPIEVTTVPSVMESLEAEQPTLPEIPSTQQEPEIQAADPVQTAEADPSPPSEATESTPPSPTSDNGLAETVRAVPPAAKEAAKEAPAATLSPETPPVLDQAKPLEQPERAAPPETALATPSTEEPAEEAPAPPAKSDPRAQASYMSGVTSRLLARRYFPAGAPSGSVVINFSVSSSGELMSDRVVRSSGSSVLDRAALNIVEKAAPFPPFPKGVTAPHLNLTVPMNFSR